MGAALGQPLACRLPVPRGVALVGWVAAAAARLGLGRPRSSVSLVVVVLRPLVSALKMRSARPLPRASSGSLAPEEQHDDRQDDDPLGPRGMPISAFIIVPQVSTWCSILRRVTWVKAAAFPCGSRRPPRPPVGRTTRGVRRQPQQQPVEPASGRRRAGPPRARRRPAHGWPRPGSTRSPSGPPAPGRVTRVASSPGWKSPADRSRGSSGCSDRGVEHVDRQHPVEPEQPRRLGAVAPGVEVGDPAAVTSRAGRRRARSPRRGTARSRRSRTWRRRLTASASWAAACAPLGVRHVGVDVGDLDGRTAPSPAAASAWPGRGRRRRGWSASALPRRVRSATISADASAAVSRSGRAR